VDDLVYQHKAKREILIGSILRTKDFSVRHIYRFYAHSRVKAFEKQTKIYI